MSGMFSWKLVHDGKTPPPGQAVAPMERMSLGRTVGIGAQHVVAMFGATFVFPLVMGLDPNLAILFSGICTILFLLIVQNRVPSYLGTSASFVAGVGAIRAGGGDSAAVTGAILVAGVLLFVIGLLVHFIGSDILKKVLPPAVTGAVVMIIGFNLAPVVAGVYWPADQWVGLAVAVFMVAGAVLFPGFWGRIAVFLGLVFGYLLSWVLDKTAGQIQAFDGGAHQHLWYDPTQNIDDPANRFHAAADGLLPLMVDRVNLSAWSGASWFGLPSGKLGDGVNVIHAPTFSGMFILLVVPGVIALIAENVGHVRAVADMTGEDLDPYMGKALAADGLATALASSFGGSPTTTYAENIGVMSATRIYSTLAYYFAAMFAIILGLCPKFGVIVNAIPGGVLGGITLILYGMIGMVGAKIWVENKVDFGNPANIVPLSAGLIAGIGDVSLKITDDFQIAGIAFGTILVIVLYHLVKGRGLDLEKHIDTEDPTYV